MNNVETTLRKYHEINRALTRGARMKGTQRGVMNENAPTYAKILSSYDNVFGDYHNNVQNNNALRIMFTGSLRKRQIIASTYKKLDKLHKELNSIARKIVATRTLQRRWRAARPDVMNKRKTASLLALRNVMTPNVRRKTVEMAFPRPVYGPLTEINALRRAIRQSKYRHLPTRSPNKYIASLFRN
jgi:hypothetical protein